MPTRRSTARQATRRRAPTRARSAFVTLAVQYATARAGLPHRRTLAQLAQAAAETDLTLTLRFVGAREGRRLNREFRQADYATNVLTFVYPSLASTPTVRGDLVLCAPVVAREARAQRKPLRAHYAHLVVHGVLHLQGYDHEAPSSAEAMEARERKILARFGYPDPYAEEADD